MLFQAAGVEYVHEGGARKRTLQSLFLVRLEAYLPNHTVRFLKCISGVVFRFASCYLVWSFRSVLTV